MLGAQAPVTRTEHCYQRPGHGIGLLLRVHPVPPAPQLHGPAWRGLARRVGGGSAQRRAAGRCGAGGGRRLRRILLPAIAAAAACGTCADPPQAPAGSRQRGARTRQRRRLAGCRPLGGANSLHAGHNCSRQGCWIERPLDRAGAGVNHQSGTDPALGDAATCAGVCLRHRSPPGGAGCNSIFACPDQLRRSWSSGSGVAECANTMETSQQIITRRQ